MDKNSLITELALGKELTEQLKNHLNPASSSPETRQFLVEKILSTYEKSLSLLNLGAFAAQNNPNFCIFSSTSSPKTEVSNDQDSKHQVQKNVFSKKRKTQQRWTEQVKVSSDTGLEGPRDDGYSWRKYGQKDILGSNFPRGYYRCTHRHSQGCLAVKQVQRSDEDPSVFEVTYRGRHTCVRASHLATPTPLLSNEITAQKQQKRPRCEDKSAPITSEKEVFFSLEELVKTENLETKKEIFRSFSFGNELLDRENEGNDIVGSVSPRFISPETSESNYFSTSSGQFDNFGMCYNVQTPESSVANSPVGDFDFPNWDFGTDFKFDSLELEFLAY